MHATPIPHATSQRAKSRAGIQVVSSTPPHKHLITSKLQSFCAAFGDAFPQRERVRRFFCGAWLGLPKAAHAIEEAVGKFRNLAKHSRNDVAMRRQLPKTFGAASPCRDSLPKGLGRWLQPNFSPRDVRDGGFNRIFCPEVFGTVASTEFFVPRRSGRKIQLNFLCQSVGDEKFNRFFCGE
jgi:hypothetical protein